MSILKEISINDIVPNKYQPRTEFDLEAISQLALSIQENGLLQPITVRESESGYELIAGERRYRAVKSLNHETISAIVIQADEIQSATLALIENIQREDLSAIEQAKAYQEMIRLTGLTQSQLAQKVGKTQSSIANKLRLLNLSDEVQNSILSHQISERHGRALLDLDFEQQKKVLKTIQNKELNVKQTEDYIKSHYKVEKKKKNKMKVFGISTRIVINSIRDTFEKAKKLNSDITLSEKETEDSYIMTITIKK